MDVPTVGRAIRSLAASGGKLVKRILVRPGMYEEEGTVEIPRHANVRIECVSSSSYSGATLRLSNVLDTANQPLVRVQSGASLEMHGIHLHHRSDGYDYWNGNAAIVCGSETKNTLDVLSLLSSSSKSEAMFSSQACNEDRTKLILRDSFVTSSTGRGIMAVGDDVSVDLYKSTVQDCASTGIFVRYGTVTLSEECIVAQNGQGSAEILPGQSSLFVDRGTLRITDDCRISGSIKSLGMNHPVRPMAPLVE